MKITIRAFEDKLITAMGIPYICFLGPDTKLPMMYIDDAVRATIELMEAPPEKIKIRTSYYIAAMGFTPAELAAEIRIQVPGFEIIYAPDHRQAIAESWPRSIDDSDALKDWKWVTCNHHNSYSG